MQILIKIAFLLLPIMSIGQISFYKHYADNGFDFAQGVVQLEDSSYVITGSSGSYASHSEAFLMHVDSTGNWLWSNHYGGPETDWGQRVLYKKNFGYFIAGYSNSFGIGDYDFYLVKVDENGQEEWSNTYGSDGWDKVMDAVMLRDTGVVMIGERQNGSYGLDMYIVRTDKNGDTLWTRTLENNGNDVANAVDLYQDSILVIGGNRFNADSSQVKPILYLMTEAGVIFDTLDFSNYSGEFELNDVQVLNDTVQALGSQRDNDQDFWGLNYYRTEISAMEFVGDFSYVENLTGDWHGDCFTWYDDASNRYLAFSFENNVNTFEGGTDVMIQYGTNLMFYINTVQFLAMVEPDVNGEIIPTSDGGAMLVGYHQNPLVGSGGGTMFLYKIGPNEVYPDASNPTTVLHSNLVSIKEEFSAIDLKVYPNPANDLLNVDVPTNEIHHFQIFDSSGKTILSGALNGSGSIDVNTFVSGVYLLKISNASGQAIHRVIIQ